MTGPSRTKSLAAPLVSLPVCETNVAAIMGVGRNLSREGPLVDFYKNISKGGLKVVKFVFSFAKPGKQPFLLKFSKSMGQGPALHPADAHVCNEVSEKRTSALAFKRFLCLIWANDFSVWLWAYKRFLCMVLSKPTISLFGFDLILKEISRISSWNITNILIACDWETDIRFKEICTFETVVHFYVWAAK